MWGVPFWASFQREASAWVREYHRAPPAAWQSGPVRPVLIPGSSSSSHWETESFGTQAGGSSPSQVVSRENSTSQAASPYLGTSAGAMAHTGRKAWASEERR